MRQAILVVILVVAAFAGGAFVDGPGLRWAQMRVLKSLGWNEGDITSIDLKPILTADSTADGAELAKLESQMMQEPLAPMPMLIAQNKSAKHDISDEHTESLGLRERNLSSEACTQSQPPLLSSRLSTLAARAVPKGSPSVLIDVAVKTAGAVSSSSVPQLDKSTNADEVPAVLDSPAGLLLPARSSSTATALPRVVSKLPGNGNNDWFVLVHKMQTLGVSHFSIDGEIGGRVVFSCLIPLAGRYAVTQRFEADGDDIAQAAQATLRRIALWRATHATSH